MNMLILQNDDYVDEEHAAKHNKIYIPHPFADRKMLKGTVLRVLESEIAEVENSSQPVELVLS
jgi:hypothetical protein